MTRRLVQRIAVDPLSVRQIAHALGELDTQIGDLGERREEAASEQRNTREQGPRRCQRAAEDHHASAGNERSEEHTSELQSLMRISYAVFCLKKKTIQRIYNITHLNISTTSPPQHRNHNTHT